MRRLSFIVAVFYVFGAPLYARAQQPTPVLKSQPVGYKDPQLATLLSVIIPGGGQFYTGNAGKGALLLAGTAAGIAIAVHGSQSTCGVGASCGSSGAEAGGLIAAVLLWGYGWASAGRDARLHNEELLNGTSFVPFLHRRDGRVLTGLSVAIK